MNQEKPLEMLERILWNSLAVFFGWLLCPLPAKFTRLNSSLIRWNIRAKDEIALGMATASVTALGMGKLHDRRLDRIRKAVFGLV
jgi:hypothetical protein